MSTRSQRIARVFAFAAAGLTVATMSACSSGNEEPPAERGPNGYSSVGQSGDYEIWADFGAESGFVDVLILDDGVRYASCLGAPTKLCVQGDITTAPAVVFVGPQDATQGTFTWPGSDTVTFEVANENFEEFSIFYAFPPGIDPATYVRPVVNLSNDAGEVVLSQ
ncbi:hypothetical protein [Humidisolicoccus flavus]|uniref:hypothetical protein n=1 Tax=Humidisolicoccus flavus TaxID=3111414 RepID=UPI003252B3C3